MTTSSYFQLLESALKAVSIESQSSFSWFGKRTPRLTAQMRRIMNSDSMRDFLKANLQARLYSDFYCRGYACSVEETTHALGSSNSRLFIQALCDANTGASSREPGWTFCGQDENLLVIERDGLNVWIERDEVFIHPRHELRIGDSVDVRFPKELLAMFPGFYMALGNCVPVRDDCVTIVRFYWNLQPEGAVALVRTISQSLNCAGIPFQLKVLSDPIRYHRCDAGVLYVEKADYIQVARVVREVYADISKYLKVGTPVFTKQLAPGLGLAEGPTDRTESFGYNRCGLLAEAILRSSELMIVPLSERIEVVAETFREVGLSLDRPFLNRGSTDDYEVL